MTALSMMVPGLAFAAMARGFPSRVGAIFPGQFLTDHGAIAAGGGVALASLLLTCRWGWRQMQRAQDARVERLVLERTAHLHRADVAKTAFVTHLSHEIRNPLNGILGAALALEAAGLDAPQHEQASIVRTCASFLSSLVEDVLDFARLEAGAVEIRHESYRPRELLAAVARMLDRQMQEAGITLNVAVASDVPECVRGDAGRVQQIVLNFILNAGKFARGHPVDLSLEIMEASLVFNVADRGPGISDEEKGRLFAGFSRLEAARKAGISGAGLGLAVSRTLAMKMGGATGVRDREGGGAIFWLRLRLEPADPQAESDVAPSDFAGARALVVEDVDYNAAALSFILNSLGFRCARARDADEAHAQLQRQTYDAVFVDCDLPGMPGPEFVRHAKSTACWQHAPVFIATTAYATKEIRRNCLEAGMDAFVSKPITPERLREVLIAFTGPLRSGISVQLPAPLRLKEDMLDFLGGDTAEGRRASRVRFVDALALSLKELADSADAAERETMRRAAHQIVGHARIVGAEPLAQLAAELELNAFLFTGEQRSSSVAEITTRVQQLSKMVLANPVPV